MSLLCEGIFPVGEVGVVSVRADVMISEGLNIDYSFHVVSGVVAGFVDVCVVICGFSIYNGL